MRVDPNYVAGLSVALSASSAAEQRLTTELSSGARVQTLSDDAVAVAANVRLSGAIHGLDAFVQSAGQQQGLLQVTDGALGEVVKQVTAALSLAVSAGNGTLNAGNLAAIGQQVTGIRDTVVGIANTTYQGQYIFSGSQSGVKPFGLDSSTVPAGVVYAGDGVVGMIRTPEGSSIAKGVAGLDAFGGVLGALNGLVADLAGGNAATIAADAGVLHDALTGLTTVRSGVGNSLSRLEATTTYAQTEETTFQVRQSALFSADPVQVATELKTAEVQHQALLGVFAQLERVNLFDYLK